MLLQGGVDLKERDFFQGRFSEAELRKLLGDRSPSELFAWRSPSFKALGVAMEALTDEELIPLMLQEPRLIRRPLIQVGEELIVGANRQALEEALG